MYDEVKREVSRLICQFWGKANKENSFCSNWELLKFEVTKYLRKFGSRLATYKRAVETAIIVEITKLTNKCPDSLLNKEKILLSVLQIKLDELYRRKAEGAFVRSRRRWLEEGEQNSQYFFNLERHHINNNLSKLNVNGIVTKDHKLISYYCCEFYKKIYTFLSSIEVKTIDKNEREFCDMHISVEEVIKAINNLK